MKGHTVQFNASNKVFTSMIENVAGVFTFYRINLKSNITVRQSQSDFS